jgi:hypothetical protein
MPDVRIIIVIVILLIILAFILYILFNIRSNTSTNTVKTRVANGSVITGSGLACDPGQCVTNIYNGSKICPQVANGVLLANPALEVCNSQFLCDNALTPYALQSDGSTDNNGVCQMGVTCRCLRSPQCSSNITSVFTTSNGTVFQSFTEQRITIAQTLVQSNANATASNVQSPNFQIVNPLVNFCTITNAWLNNISPGICNDTVIGDPTSVAECQHRNPCIAGTLAFVPTNINEFTSADINVTGLACVFGKNTCSSNQLLTWDSGINEPRCITITT